MDRCACCARKSERLLPPYQLDSFSQIRSVIKSNTILIYVPSLSYPQGWVAHTLAPHMTVRWRLLSLVFFDGEGIVLIKPNICSGRFVFMLLPSISLPVHLPTNPMETRHVHWTASPRFHAFLTVHGWGNCSHKFISSPRCSN